MKNQIIIDNLREDVTIAAIKENGEIIEFWAERKNAESVVGNVYSGIISQITPNQFMFADVGLPKNAFIYLNDPRETINSDKTYKQGDTVLLQIIKDETGKKGSAASTSLTFAGMYSILSRTSPHCPKQISVSRKITDEVERERLKKCILSVLPDGFSAIIRTKSQNVSEPDIISDFNQLLNLFALSSSDWQFVRPPALIHHNGTAATRLLRELYTSDTERIITNCPNFHNQLTTAASSYNISHKIELYDETSKFLSLFSAFDVSKPLQTALENRVWLPCGGFIVIEKTEAMYVIDVNTGTFIGKHGHEDSVLTVNTEAAHAIARQLRLRNLSGIIIIDFINMKEHKSTQAVTNALCEAVKPDRYGVCVVGFTELGLMQLTRKKTKEPLSSIIKLGG